MMVLLRFGLQQIGQLSDRLLGINRAAGVVGRVDNHRLGMRGDGPLQRLKIDLEGLDIRRDQHHFGARSLNKHLVFREVRGKHNNLVLRTAQTAQAAAQRGRRAHGNIQIIGTDLRTETAVDGIGKPGAHSQVTLGAGVPVQQDGIGILQQIHRRFIHAVRRRNAGIADGKIKDVLCADLGGAQFAELEKLANYGTLGAKAHHSLGKLCLHEKPLLFFSSTFFRGRNILYNTEKNRKNQAPIPFPGEKVPSFSPFGRKFCGQNFPTGVSGHNFFAFFLYTKTKKKNTASFSPSGLRGRRRECILGKDWGKE